MHDAGPLGNAARGPGGLPAPPADSASPNASLCSIAVLWTLSPRRAPKNSPSAPSRRRPWLQAPGRRGDPSRGEQVLTFPRTLPVERAFFLDVNMAFLR